MPFRSIVIEPEHLAEMQAVFDRAWAAIEVRGTIDPMFVQQWRERLAYIIAELWKMDFAGDRAELAVERFLRARPED